MEYLYKRQKKYPPKFEKRQGFDRAQQLLQNLVPILPPGLIEMLSRKELCVGEIGSNTPNIQKIGLPNNNSIIEFNSGMMDFVYAIARILSGLFVRTTKSPLKDHPVLTRQEVKVLISKIFAQWKWQKRWLWKFCRIQYPSFSISDDAHRWAEEFSNVAELFMLGHEIGHVLLDMKILPPQSGYEEEDADTISVMLLFKLANHKVADLGFYFAGIVFAIRIFVGLEAVGIQFSSAYSKQIKRLNNIINCTASLLPSKQYFHEISRIATATNNMMHDVQSILVKNTEQLEPNIDFIIPHLIAELLEVVLDRAPKEVVINDIIKKTKEIPPKEMKQTIHTLYNYYITSYQKDSFIDSSTKLKMGQLLNECLLALPTETKSILDL